MENSPQNNVSSLEKVIVQKTNRIRNEGLNVKKRDAIVIISTVIFGLLAMSYLLFIIFLKEHSTVICITFVLSLFGLVLTMRYLLQIEDNMMYKYWGINTKRQWFFTFQNEAEKEFRLLIASILDKELIDENYLTGSRDDKEKLNFILGKLSEKREESKLHLIVLTYNYAFITALMTIGYSIIEAICKYYHLSASDLPLIISVSIVVYLLIFSAYYAVYNMCQLIKDIREKEVKRINNVHKYLGLILEKRVMVG